MHHRRTNVLQHIKEHKYRLNEWQTAHNTRAKQEAESKLKEYLLLSSNGVGQFADNEQT